MQVIEGSLQILIHQLPVRAQIDTILSEQLIVELYSKNLAQPVCRVSPERLRAHGILAG